MTEYFEIMDQLRAGRIPSARPSRPRVVWLAVALALFCAATAFWAAARI